jgi:hypothetical protein
MSYPFQLFLTRKNLSIQDLENINNIFNSLSNKVSILNEYKHEIEQYIEINNININNIDKSILIKISKYYDEYLNKNTKQFFIYLVGFKSIIYNNVVHINTFNNIYNNLTRNKINTYNEKYIYYNPFSYEYPNTFNKLNKINNNKKFINLSIFKKINSNYDSNINNNIKVSIDILTQGKYINLSLPSIGVINNSFSSNKSLSYIDFISKLTEINDEKNKNVLENIPLKSMELGNIISDLLFENIIDDYNIAIKNVFINMIKNINFNLEDVFYLSKKINNKVITKIKTEYIIPYKIDSKNNDIIALTKNDIDKYKTIKDLCDKNNSIINYVVNKVFLSGNNKKIYLEKNNFKNVLACYLFYIINLTFNICKLYINKIDEFLINVIESKDKRYSFLNIKLAFDFTSALSKSLYKFKTVLLNNFYYYFLPSKILSGNYGMKLNEFDCYIPEYNFLINNDDLINYYPFNNIINSKKIFVNKNNLIKFVLDIRAKVDIYNSSLKLELGGYSFNFNILKKSILILLDYYKILDKTNQFNLFIIKLLINNFKDKRKIPIELINDIEYYINYSRFDITEYERIVLLKYENNLEKATNFILNVINIRSKIKNSKNNNVNDLNNLEDINYLSYIIYYLKSQGIFNIIKNIDININLKNSLLNKLLKTKIEYEKMIKY